MVWLTALAVVVGCLAGAILMVVFAISVFRGMGPK